MLETHVSDVDHGHQNALIDTTYREHEALRKNDIVLETHVSDVAHGHQNALIDTT